MKNCGLKPIWRSSFILSFVLVLLFLSSGAIYGIDEPTIEYRVVKKDYLIKIGKRIFEDPSKWREVAKINRIKDPNIIYPDQRLIIPVRLLRGSPMDGTVTFVKGDAMLQRNNSQEWIKLKQGDLIKQGDSLKTGDKSTLEITFEDKSILFMRPNTLLTVNTLEKNILNPSNSGHDQFVEVKLFHKEQKEKNQKRGYK